ncbi:MAG: tetratricopeptide repeat protein [Pseudomonadota bacterium]|jgi:tetratricopeptide (TPR) repeat protein
MNNWLLRVKSPLAAACLAVLVVVSAGAAEKEKKETLTEAVAKQLKPAQDAIAKGDFDAGVTLAKGGLAAAKSNYDKETSLRMLTYAAAKKQDFTLYAEYTEQLLEVVPAMPDDERIRDYKALGQINAQNKVYDKALVWIQKWADATKSADAYTLGSQIFLIQQDYAGAIPWLEKVVAASPEPKEETLKLLNVSYYRTNEKVKRQATMETLVAKFPRREYLVDLMGVYEADADPRAMLNLYRLLFDRNEMTRESEYVNYADSALDAGGPAEALRALEQGQKRDVIKFIAATDRNSKMLALAKTQTAEDKKMLPGLDKEARAGKNGEADVKVGLAYLGFGDFDKAIEAIERGLGDERVAKVKRVDDAYMTLGIAYLHAGKQDKAIAAFQKAKADKRMDRAANTWLIAMPTLDAPAG